MNRIIIFLSFLILNLFFLDAISQKRLKYEGPFPTSLRQPAEVTYTYFIDKNGKKIKDGIFRYVVKVKETRNNIKIHHFVTIQGSYNKDLMHDSWDYRIMSRNYENENDDYLYSEIQLKAKYKNGIPDGKWEYKADVKKRSIKENSGNRVLWNQYNDIKNIEIKLNFDKGLLIDSLVIKSEQFGEIIAFMDNSGLLQGDFVIKEITKKYFKGFPINQNQENKSELNAYKKYLDQPNADIIIDTLSILNSNDYGIKKIINNEVFNEKHFLYSYLDASKNDKNSSCKTIDKYFGLYYISLKPNISDEFSKKSIELKSLANKVKYQKELFINKYGKYPEKREDQVKLSKLQEYQKAINSYICLSNQLDKEAIIDNAIKYASNQCKNNYKEFENKSRIEIINIMNTKAKKLYQMALTIK